MLMEYLNVSKDYANAATHSIVILKCAEKGRELQFKYDRDHRMEWRKL